MTSRSMMLFAAALYVGGIAALAWVTTQDDTTPGVPAEGTGTPGVPLLAMALLTPDSPELPADPVDAAVADWALVLGGGR